MESPRACDSITARLRVAVTRHPGKMRFWQRSDRNRRWTMPLNLTLLRGDLATLIPEAPPIPLPLPGTVHIVTGPGLVGFKLNGVLHWLVDRMGLAGAPALTYGTLITG